jgi:hypothetical protein
MARSNPKEKVRREKQLKIWLTEKEHQALADHAAHHGLTSSDVVRQFIRKTDAYLNLIFARAKPKKVSS